MNEGVFDYISLIGPFQCHYSICVNIACVRASVCFKKILLLAANLALYPDKKYPIDIGHHNLSKTKYRRNSLNHCGVVSYNQTSKYIQSFASYYFLLRQLVNIHCQMRPYPKHVQHPHPQRNHLVAFKDIQKSSWRSPILRSPPRLYKYQQVQLNIECCRSEIFVCQYYFFICN